MRWPLSLRFRGADVVTTQIVTGRIVPLKIQRGRGDKGSELVFNGRVRCCEGDEEIVALEYEHYEGMAQKELQAVAEEAARKFPIHHLLCRHRVGKVPVGHVSLWVSIWSEHREEGFDAMVWFISQLKKRVPIWKWAILPDGSRHPSGNRED